MAEALLALEGLRAGYGDAVVLDGITFEVRDGGSLALLGRNGVGKTTLLLTIMGFTRVSRGTIAWRGRDITRLAPAWARTRRDRLGGAGARDISLPQRGGKSHGCRAAGTVVAGAGLSPCSRGSRSGGPAPAIISRAASSRCWRSRAR